MKALDVLRRRQPWLITPESLDHFAARAAAFTTGQLFNEEPALPDLLSIEDRVGIVRLQSAEGWSSIPKEWLGWLRITRGW